MKISHKIVIGFAAPALFAGLLSHIYMAKCQETGREQERVFLSALASLNGLERLNLKGTEIAGEPLARIRISSEEARQKFTRARKRFDAFMHMVEYLQYAFAGLLLLLAVFTLKNILMPVKNMAAAAMRLRDGQLGVKVPVRAKDEIGLLAETFNSMSAELRERERQLKHSNWELTEALKNIKTLYGLLPICASCKNIRDDKGYWHKLENYLKEHSDIRFTHGLCEDCVKKLYPQYADK